MSAHVPQMVAYGAHCTWWGLLGETLLHRPSNASHPYCEDTPHEHREGGIVCPHCMRKVYVTTLGEWEDAVTAHEAANYPHYKEMIAWAQGRCFPSLAAQNQGWLKYDSLKQEEKRRDRQRRHVLDLEMMFPGIPWRRPIQVTGIGLGAVEFACRICIAANGLDAEKLSRHPNTMGEFEDHLKNLHGINLGQ